MSSLGYTSFEQLHDEHYDIDRRVRRLEGRHGITEAKDDDIRTERRQRITRLADQLVDYCY